MQPYGKIEGSNKGCSRVETHTSFDHLFQAVTHHYMSLREEESMVGSPDNKSVASP